MLRTRSVLLASLIAWASLATPLLGAQALSTSPSGQDEPRIPHLVALTRLMGYVRYFHPSDGILEADWDELAVTAVRAIRHTRNAAELADRLETVFQPLAPTVQVFPTGTNPRPVLPPAAVQELPVRIWVHQGLGGTFSSSLYRSSLAVGRGQSRVRGIFGKGQEIVLPEYWPPFEAALGAGLTARVPTAVPVFRKSSVPRARQPRLELRSEPSARSVRLAAVMLCWNALRHFYPYFDVVEVDWDAELVRALQETLAATNERQYYEVLARMVAALDDGHGRVSHEEEGGGFQPPLRWEWVEDQLVVTQVDAEAAENDETQDIRPGDVILSINGVPAEQLVAEAGALVSSATPQYRWHRAAAELVQFSEGKRILLEVEEPEGAVREVFLRCTMRAFQIRERRPENLGEIEPGIVYVDIDRVKGQDFLQALPRLLQARGIIFDFRGYPRHIQPGQFLPYLTQEPLRSAQWHIPLITGPEEVQYYRGGEWYLPPAVPYIRARKVFLIDGRAISYAESCLGIVEHYGLGELVGEPTAGTNGNINRFELPGGYQVVFTGMKALKHDGSRHHGIGIHPTVPVARTVEGIREGRDELLERALEVVRGD